MFIMPLISSTIDACFSLKMRMTRIISQIETSSQGRQSQAITLYYNIFKCNFEPSLYSRQ